MATLLKRKLTFVGSATLKLPWNQQTRRNFNVLEHVSCKLLSEAGIPVPKFGVAKSKKEAGDIVRNLGIKDIVVKAQVLAGGRGVGHFKGGLKGGVQMCSTPEEAEKLAGQMIGDYLITKQTGEKGRVCNAVMITERKFPLREFYFAIVMDQTYSGPVLMASSQVRINVEDIAATNPEAILYVPIDIESGISKETALNVADVVGLKEKRDYNAEILLKMYDLFIKKDALLIEINPYVEDENGNYFSLDAKFKFDGNADFRQKELVALRDFSQEDETEVKAQKYNFNYTALDGNIGCLVNDASLAMATSDIIKLHGGSPANTLDIGNGDNAGMIKEALKIITSDPNSHAILINVFGGITRCDTVAQGIIAAIKECTVKVPIVCRLQGTNSKEAMDIIASSGIKILLCEDLDEAAQLAVKVTSVMILSREVLH